MADDDVTIKDAANADKKIDVRSVGAGADEMRQVMVIGDPTAAARVVGVSSDGNLNIEVRTGTLSAEVLFPSADALALGSVSGLQAVGALYVFNGTNWDRLRGNTNGLFAQGNVAHDAVDSGNPVKIGGRSDASIPTVTSAAGDRVDAWFGRSGQFMVGTVAGLTTLGDGTSGQTIQLYGSSDTIFSAKIPTLLYGFNGTTWDRIRTANTGRLQVDVVTAPSSATAGDVAHDAVDSGNPVKIGGKANDARIAVADGDRVDAWFGRAGQQVAAVGSATIGAGADGMSARGWNTVDSATGLFHPMPGALYGFNGTSWDRIRVANTGRLQVDVVNGFTAVAGDVAHDAVDSGNPVKIGGKANNSPVVVATGDRVDSWFDTRGALHTVISRNGATAQVSGITSLDGVSNTNGDALSTLGFVHAFNGTTWDRLRTIGGLPAADANTGIPAFALVPHKTGYAAASATARYTTAQTSTVLGATVGASQKAIVTSIQIQAGGTTAGEVQVYFGTGAYVRGTTRAIFDGEFAPSATSKPGYAQSPPVPYEGTADGEIRVTTSAAITLTVTVWYYVVG